MMSARNLMSHTYDLEGFFKVSSIMQEDFFRFCNNYIYLLKKKSDMEKGLPHPYLTALSAIFKNFPEIELVKLYGSRAIGNNSPQSDIDLSIERNIILKTMVKLKMELDDSDTSLLFDVQHYTTIKNPCLKEHIDRVGKVLYDKLPV